MPEASVGTSKQDRFTRPESTATSTDEVFGKRRAGPGVLAGEGLGERSTDRTPPLCCRRVWPGRCRWIMLRLLCSADAVCRRDREGLCFVRLTSNRSTPARYGGWGGAGTTSCR